MFFYNVLDPLEVKSGADAGDLGDRGETSAFVGVKASHPHGLGLPEFCPCTSIRTFSCLAEWNSLETSDSKGYVGTLDGGFKLPSSVNPIGGPN